MALFECPECDKKISVTVDNCPKCGYQFLDGEIDELIEDEKKSKLRRRLIWGICILLFFGLPIITNFYISSMNINLNDPAPQTNSTQNDFSNNFSYDVINRTRTAGIKSSIEIMLREKLPKSKLKILAMELKNGEPKNIKNVFITYYLPGMKPGSGAWASSHFTPDLKIKIYEITSHKEKQLKNNSRKESTGAIIGEWIYEIAGAKYTFVKKDGKVVMIIKFNDGSGSETEMIQRKGAGKIRFEEMDGNRFGEYYIIENNGDLAAYDDSGPIIIMPSIND